MTDRVLTDSKVLMWLNNVRAFPSYMKGVVHERFEATCVSHRLLQKRVTQLEQEIGALTR